MSRFGVHAMALVLGASAGFGSVSGHAQVAAADAGCPQFHCTPEATGAMDQLIVTPSAPTITGSDLVGTLYAQACSGDGTLLACLVGDSASGTLQIVDTTARPEMTVVDSDGNSFPNDLLGEGWFRGQVPFMFADGRIGAGDAKKYRIYDFSTGSVTAAALPVFVPQGAATMGLTDLGNGTGVVARTDGVLMFIDMASGSKVGPYVRLKDENGLAVTLQSPPSASTDTNVLYVVARNSAGDKGYLYAVSASGVVNWMYGPYGGASGASPVVATPEATGYSQPLILLDVPVPDPDIGTTPQLQGIIDNASSAELQWYIPLDKSLAVAPVVDKANQRLYFIYKDDDKVFGYPLHVSDTDPNPGKPEGNTNGLAYNLLARTNLGSLQLNSHLGAVRTGSSSASYFTLLLAGKTTSGDQYMIAYRPIPWSMNAWKVAISNPPAQYTAAWNLARANPSGINAGLYCPLVVEGGPASPNTSNGLVLACDW